MRILTMVVGSPGETFGHVEMPFELPSEGPKPSMLLRVDLSTTPPGYKLVEIREFYLTFCLQRVIC